jgi:hypothetical protein
MLSYHSIVYTYVSFPLEYQQRQSTISASTTPLQRDNSPKLTIEAEALRSAYVSNDLLFVQYNV